MPERDRSRFRRPARVVIADDHELTREGLRNMLVSQRGLAVVGEAADGIGALALCRQMQPDLVLLDVRLPALDGLATAKAIRAACPGTAVIVMSMHHQPGYLAEALRVGAAGYIPKDATRREIVTAVWRILRGQRPPRGAMATELLLEAS